MKRWNEYKDRKSKIRMVENLHCEWGLKGLEWISLNLRTRRAESLDGAMGLLHELSRGMDTIYIVNFKKSGREFEIPWNSSMRREREMVLRTEVTDSFRAVNGSLYSEQQGIPPPGFEYPGVWSISPLEWNRIMY